MKEIIQSLKGELKETRKRKYMNRRYHRIRGFIAKGGCQYEKVEAGVL
jgi:hypothetical protein